MSTVLRGTSPFSLLLNLPEAPISRGAMKRHESIAEALRTRHRFARVDVAARSEETRVYSPLGLGYLKAVLAVLRLPPRSLSYDPPGLCGRLEVQSREMYYLTWNEADGVECMLGGFRHEGKPTYHAAMLGLVQALAMYLSGERLQSEEVFKAWCDLLRAMERRFSRANRQWGWPESEIGDACVFADTRQCILHLCDALRAQMQYHFASKSRRNVSVYEEVVVEPEQGASLTLDGWRLLDAAWLEEEAAKTPLLPMPRPPEDPAHPAPEKATPASSPAPSAAPAKVFTSSRVGAPAGLPPVGMPAPGGTGATGVALPATPPAPAPTPAGSPPPPPRSRSRPPLSPLAGVVKKAASGTPAATMPAKAPGEDLYGPHLETVSMALAQGGSLMLVGRTGTGKSSLLLDAAIDGLGWGVELIVCHEGKRIHSLQGVHSRDAGKGEDWRFAAGPITRLARRVQRGEHIVLIWDELARAHPEVFAYVMDLLNTYSLREVQAMAGTSEWDLEGDDMRLELPPDFGRDASERYHILAVDVLQKRFVVSSRRLLICATANQGEAYGGVDFTDPAFGRRWSHWLHLKGYEPDVVRQILASKCGLSTSASLFDAILKVEKEVHTYHMDTDALKMTLSLPLLIQWARQTQWYYTDPRSRVRSNARLAFEAAARAAWLDRVCPYEGDELDKEVLKKLMGFLSGVSLSKLT